VEKIKLGAGNSVVTNIVKVTMKGPGQRQNPFYDILLKVVEEG
jgi:hypothetical protein